MTPTGATISWRQAPVDAGCGELAPDGYELTATDGTVLKTVPYGFASAVLTDLQPSTTYTLHVHSTKASGQVPSTDGADSPDVTFTTLPAVVVTPTPTPEPTTTTTAYGVTGFATLNNVAKGAVTLTGSTTLAVTSTFNPGSPTPVKSFTGDLTLAPTTTTLKALGFLPVTATIAFVPTAPLTGSAGDASATASLKTRIKIPSVKVFGISLGGGSGCQSTQISTIPLVSSAPFVGTATFTGSFSISNLSGCGALNGLVSPLTAGGGNALALTLSPAAAPVAN